MSEGGRETGCIHLYDNEYWWMDRRRRGRIEEESP